MSKENYIDPSIVSVGAKLTGDKSSISVLCSEIIFKIEIIIRDIICV